MSKKSEWYEPWSNIRYDPTLVPYERRDVIAYYRSLYNSHKTFIETGTSNGDTTLAMSPLFHQVYTIEIAPSIYHRTKQTVGAQVRNVEFLLGDSTDILPKILEKVTTPCIFWLDGHYCGDPEGRGPKDTPICDELKIIFADKKPHVILVDDARLFGNDSVYPEISWVRNLATTQDIEFKFSYINDIMRVVPA